MGGRCSQAVMCGVVLALGPAAKRCMPCPRPCLTQVESATGGQVDVSPLMDSAFETFLKLYPAPELQWLDMTADREVSGRWAGRQDGMGLWEGGGQGRVGTMGGRWEGRTPGAGAGWSPAQERATQSLDELYYLYRYTVNKCSAGFAYRRIRSADHIARAVRATGGEYSGTSGAHQKANSSWALSATHPVTQLVYECSTSQLQSDTNSARFNNSASSHY